VLQHGRAGGGGEERGGEAAVAAAAAAARSVDLARGRSRARGSTKIT